MRAFIYTGGSLCTENITEYPEADDICIAADSGYKNAEKLGVKINILVGDFDSLDAASLDGVSKDTELVRVPAEKDFTDTQLAVKIALEKGAKGIVIIGGLGGRLDHTLSNLAILQKIYSGGGRAVMTDGHNRIRYIKNSSDIISRSKFKYLSVIACDEKVKGVEIDGCKYPLKNATLSSLDQYAVSNEILKNCAFISVKKGGIYIIESCDA